MKSEGKEPRNGPFLHEKMFPWEHVGNSVFIGTLFLILVIRSAKQDDIYGASNIVLPCPSS
jgi:hypothetical protein